MGRKVLSQRAFPVLLGVGLFGIIYLAIVLNASTDTALIILDMCQVPG